mgnify:FL=1
MKKYTEKQIESFKEMINNGIISQIDGDCELCRKISTDIHEINEGYFTFESITTNEIVNEWDARGEKGHLIDTLIESYDKPEIILKDIVKTYSECFLPDQVDRKYMIRLLGLRDYATKEDILNELKEIL